MVETIINLFRKERPDVVDGLMRLADGDVDRLQKAIRLAAGSRDVADLEAVVERLMELRTEKGMAAA